MRILVVERDEEARRTTLDAVAGAGWELAAEAATVREARDLADGTHPDLVLLDAGLRGECAGEACFFGLPIILMTSGSEREGGVWPDGVPVGRLRRPVTAVQLRAAAELELWKRRMLNDLGRARREALVAERAKTSFLATISHELRTPMNGVLGMTELLLLSDLEEPYRENVDLIRQSAQSLLSVLNQIIDYSRLEASSPRLREADFRMEDLLTGVLSQHRRAAAAKGVRLGYTLDPAMPGWLRGDAGKIRQALGNLLANAVKFTASGQIMVDVSPEPGPDGAPGEDVVQVRVLVQDTGVGIPPDRMDAIFESFVQGGDHLAHTSGGLGLGLAIVNRLVTMLGGTVHCASREGRGSTFSFAIPLGRSRYETRSPLETAMGEDKPLAGARVLVAEDETVNQRYLTRLLEKMGCAVTLAENGLEAVEALRAAPFDIVLMDVEMPVMNGIDATRAIRRPETGCLAPAVPIVALTAHAMWGDEQRCRHAGMTDYVPKPVDIGTVAAIIQSILDGRDGEEAFAATFVQGD
ncbi:hybrid sensor histidine kinase/response regulator [Pseudodesulfovibrio sp.]|uniref:hybrid sensor histidine kinase/response regulator n=1 Tax=Pseudodesulfovibrio sp. TaxID=2035812 RepID=UPI0026389CBA|nr:hybrid sensor histidine kinase/response regulator [Pseudodesulfovibrio sp.]MDD3311841.1 response regulator [Pseudodesulfovibrio sp.]